MSVSAEEVDGPGARVTELDAVRSARPATPRSRSIVGAMRAMERRATATPPTDMAEWLAARRTASAAERLAAKGNLRAEFVSALLADVLDDEL
jgi:hypothetical protein